MAKILITESVHPIGPELLTAAGHTVVYADRDMDVIRREIVDADAVLVRIIELPGSLLATAKNLKIVSKHGVGYDNIDLDYCKSHGIAVTITPNANSLSVAEHAFTLMLTLAKNIIPVSNEYRTVGFAAKNHAPGIEMTGKTLGLVGMGRIGKHILHMCRDGLDMHVIVYDPYISEIPEGVEKVDDLSELLRRADVVTLHCLLTDETRKLIDRERLALMKPTALLINCARGPIVDEAALIELNALDGQLSGGGVDLRLAEDDGDAALEQGLIDPLDVIAVDDAEARQATDTEDGAQLLCELLRLHVEARLLLNVGAEDHSSCPSRCWTCPPCCGRRPFPYMERAARARRAVATQLGGRNQAFIMTRDGRAWGEVALRFSGSKRRAPARPRGCSSRRLR